MMKKKASSATPVAAADDDDWDTDPDFVNDVTEKEARRNNPHVAMGEKETVFLLHANS